MASASFVTVTYNSEGSIGELLNQILNSPILTEIIVIDNNSLDKTREILKKFEKNNDTRLKIILNDKNMGYRKAINQGIKEAKNNIVFISNPDIIISDLEIFRILTSAFNKDNNVAMAYPITFSNDFYYNYNEEYDISQFILPFLPMYRKKKRKPI